MSKLYTTYLKLKSQDTTDKTVYLFKSGIFYLFLEEDAKLMSSILSLKLCPLNETVVKCSFPSTHLQKYLNILKQTSYKVKIIDLSENTLLDSNSYMQNEKIKLIIKRFRDIDVDSLSVQESYDFLYWLKKELLSLDQ